MHRIAIRGWVHAGLALLTTVVVLAQSTMGSKAQVTPSAKGIGLGTLPIQEQPFYPALEKTAESWSDVVLDQVVGNSPEATLLNFYAVMAEVGRKADALGKQESLQNGMLTSEQRREQIDDTNLLFSLAVRALDASAFPESVRQDMADEAAIQLKHVLDYVFSHSRTEFSIPDQAGMKKLNDYRTTPSESWRIPGTAITLTTSISKDSENEDYFFSKETVKSISEMYSEIREIPAAKQPFATPYFYNDFIYTPGYLVPPRWYISLPRGVRNWLEIPIQDQTLLQIALAAIVVGLLAWCLIWLFGLLASTYRVDSEENNHALIWIRDSIAWRRVLLLFPALPLTRLAEVIVDDVINFTGLPLAIATYGFFIVWYLTAGVFAFYLFEAIGRSCSEFLARIRGGQSPLRLQRTTNFVMPICRIMGAGTFVFLIYRLLILLGLPPSTVFAFSAVPGLAIGLGASKLLGNLFAGLSIQTDRPLRIGDFCRVGDHLGFIKKIGLRSLEIETLESRVTVPNSVADEATIVNYSQPSGQELIPCQGLEVKLPISSEFSPFQIEELLRQSRRGLQSLSILEEPIVSIEIAEGDGLQVIAFGTVHLHGWNAYLETRENLLVHMHEFIERAQFSEMTVPVSYSTTPQNLKRLPELLKACVNQDNQLHFGACRLEEIADFSYNHILEFSSTHDVHDDFEDSIHDLNRRVIELIAKEGLEIPFPTQTLQLSK